MNTVCTQPNGALCAVTEQTNLASTAPHSGLRDQLLATGVARRITAMKRAIATHYQRRIDRQAFKSLTRLDDHMLRDIGVTKLDVKWASRLPLSEDAASRLEAIARRR